MKIRAHSPEPLDQRVVIWKDDDPSVLSDRDKSRRLREIPVSEFCATVKKGCK